MSVPMIEYWFIGYGCGYDDDESDTDIEVQ
jgi:hypothetical protein